MVRYCLIAAATLLAGCLPGDNRPPPGSVYLTAEPSDAVTSGFTTSDGWQVTFERLLVGLGDVSLGSMGCTSYADASYERLFDFVAAKGPQKLSEVYGLGPCILGIGMATPASDAPLGTRVTAADLAFMRTPGVDMWTIDRSGTYAGMTRPYGGSVFVRGQASKGAVTKGFSWMFRRHYAAVRCPAGPAAETDAGYASTLRLHGGDVLKLRVVLHGEELFRESNADDAVLRFDALADADINGDQTITLDELAKIPWQPPDLDAGLLAGIDGGSSSLADLIHELLVAHMIHLGDGGPCKARFE